MLRYGMIRKMSKKPTSRIDPEYESEERKNTIFRIEAMAIIRAGRYLIWFTLTVLAIVFTVWKLQ